MWGWICNLLRVLVPTGFAMCGYQPPFSNRIGAPSCRLEDAGVSLLLISLPSAIQAVRAGGPRDGMMSTLAPWRRTIHARTVSRAAGPRTGSGPHRTFQRQAYVVGPPRSGSLRKGRVHGPPRRRAFTFLTSRARLRMELRKLVEIACFIFFPSLSPPRSPRFCSAPKRYAIHSCPSIPLGG